jgi:hypothetical protein
VAGVLGLIRCGELVVDTGQLGNIGDLRDRDEPAAPEAATFALDTALLVSAFLPLLFRTFPGW